MTFPGVEHRWPAIGVDYSHVGVSFGDLIVSATHGSWAVTAPNGGDGIGGSDYVHPSVAGQANVVAPTIRAGLNDLLDFLVPPTVVSPSTVSASATVPAPTVSADNGGVVVKMWNGSTWVTVTPVVM